ncbi:hypothetical protein PC118_g4128 [Phytophthora cactorum]|uniref:Uncharacterized protein n=1 Tax=Phytophthora cactorum TaxID=29920 RepID=A0A8T1E773_9STRA|nr:hypothetical protein PC115_g4080 [Phytophthora cactorum]KAG2950252.1 hypothetical protein PC117_g4587 [Phytophthora cactorum]KAG2993215.1 hypothetical protein PC118_g4128 [Phytophthora cactorum]KAG3023406.1 hypothetical protein PC120_g7579 [Phytophthora cactorum]
MFRNGAFGPMRYCMPSDVWDRFSCGLPPAERFSGSRRHGVVIPAGGWVETCKSPHCAKPAVTTEAALVETEDSPFEQQGTEH